MSQLSTNYDYEKLLLGNNFNSEGNIAASGADVVLAVGDVLGRISSTNKVVKCTAAATDGSQYPVGLAFYAQTITDGTSKDVSFVNKGLVNENMLSFSDASTLDTPIGVASNQKTYRDHLNALGLVLKASTEMSEYDNE